MVITFEMIREVHRKEKDSPSLQKLPEGFFDEVSEYLKAKEGSKSDPADFIELENARMVVNDIIDRREHKILEGAMVFVRSGIPLHNMLPHEKELFEKIVSILREYRKEFWEMIKNRNSDTVESEEKREVVEPEIEEETESDDELERIEERLEIIEDIDEAEPDFEDLYLVLKDLPAFIWSDNRKYLIKENDVVKLPNELASMLEKRGVLKKIKS